jgi:hypothetical protein
MCLQFCVGTLASTNGQIKRISAYGENIIVRGSAA